MTSLVALQLVCGAILRHTGSALIPHLLGAGAVLVAAGLVIRRLIRHQDWGLRRVSFLLAVSLAIQVILGFLALAHRDHVLLTTAHQALGALVFASACVVTVRACHPADMTRAAMRHSLPEDLVAWPSKAS